MRRETARMNETTAAQWTIPTVMPNSTVFKQGNMEKQLDVRFFPNVLAFIK